MIKRHHSALVSGPCLVVVSRFFECLRVLHPNAQEVLLDGPMENPDDDTVVLARVTVDEKANYCIAVNRATFLRIAAAA
jgi:hypothetical protein